MSRLRCRGWRVRREGGLAQGEALRFMCKQVGESQNYVLRQPAYEGILSLSISWKHGFASHVNPSRLSPTKELHVPVWW